MFFPCFGRTECLLAVEVHGGLCNCTVKVLNNRNHGSKYKYLVMQFASRYKYVCIRFQLILSCLNIILYHQRWSIQITTHNLQKRKKSMFFFTNLNQSPLGIHLLHQRLFRRLLISSMLSFNVFKIFLCSRRAEAKAFLPSALAFFLLVGSNSCTLYRSVTPEKITTLMISEWMVIFHTPIFSFCTPLVYVH